jgi:penicillin amidase
LKARNRLLADALQAAVEEVRPPGSGDRTWGRLHSLTFRHALAVTDAGRRRFNLGPFEQSGYAGTVMSTYGSGFDVDGGASFRQVLDLGDWDRSAATSAPGQSERPASAHFADLARLWAVGDYFPLAFTERAVQEHAESSLTLIPAH